MAIVSLEITNFRCIEKAALEFDRRCTVVSGMNAQGKTSVLEAIHVLSSGRSFRTSDLDLMPCHPTREFMIAGKVEQKNQLSSIGFKCDSKGKEIHFNGHRCRGFSEIAARLPVRIIDPSGHKLIEDGPAQRRRFIDWGVFHVERRFHEIWRAYSAALAQRNAALKAQQPQNLVKSWNETLVASGEEIGRFRDDYIQNLEALVANFGYALLGARISLQSKRGWGPDLPFARQLDESWSRDVRYRSTSIGPHRAELEIFVDGKAARGCISRGQQKMLACSLVLAQLQYHYEMGGDPGTLLLDDPAAELDVHNLGKLMELIAKIPAQFVVTAVDPTTVEIINPGKKFHVKQGRIDRVL